MTISYIAVILQFWCNNTLKCFALEQSKKSNKAKNSTRNIT